MKKIFTLIAMAAMAVGAMAQTVTVNKTDGTKVTYNASEITSIEFAPQADTTIIHEFSGYLLVSSAYFSNTYYGDSAKMTVMSVGDQYLCKFEDTTWGTGLFNITLSRGSISGSGTLNMPNPHGGTATGYEATMSGTMTNIQISVPSVMGGTTINWIYGDPGAYKVAGTYSATDSINVGGAFPYKSAAADEYTLTATSDSTLDVVVPAQQYNGTVMGDLTLSSYTIKNVTWNAANKDYECAYKDQNITFHFTAVQNGTTTMDNEYTMDKDVCKIVVKPNDDGTVTISNTYQMGAMPFTIYGTFVGTKK